MAVNTSHKIVITDNTVERIECLDDGIRFAILSRVKGDRQPSISIFAIPDRGKNNPLDSDNIIVLNPTEARDCANFIRERLFARYE